MRQGCVVLLSLLLSPAALAECVWPAGGFGASGLPIEVSNADRRELEHLLGARLDGVACGRMSRERPRSFVAKSGFFLLTQDEALFVGDRKVKEILFRTRFVAIRHVSRTTFGSLRLTLSVANSVTVLLARSRAFTLCSATSGPQPVTQRGLKTTVNS